MKLVYITGITGQVGSMLADFYLNKGFYVVGLVRRTSTNNTERIAHILGNPNLELVQADITDAASLHKSINHFKPDFLCHAAAQSQVRISFDEPYHTMLTTGMGTLNILEALVKESPHTKSVFFNSSEMFGSACDKDGLQRETTPFMPCSVYGIAKLASHHLVNVYRKSYGIFACSAICFNMESSRRGDNFVTKKITKWLAEFHQAKENSWSWSKIKLGNINAQRDWNAVRDSILAVDLMLNHKEPDDFVISSGETHSVREFFQEALNLVEPGYKIDDLYEVDKSLLRPYELPYLRGDSTKIREKLGWKPKVGFKELIREMVAADVRDLMNKELDYVSDR